MRRVLVAAVLVGFMACVPPFVACSSGQVVSTQPSNKIERRPLVTTLDGRWMGAGVSYGPFRDGQSPNGTLPSASQVEEDLQILARHWSMLRMYGSRGVTEDVCRIIHERKLPLKVMVGAWVAPEGKAAADGKGVEPLPEVATINRAEVDCAVSLAKRYPDVVVAVSVGNETQVTWSDHKVPSELLIRYIRQVRAAVKVPVTTCDDFSYWNKPESRAVAEECDFLGTHIYAMWNKQSLTNAMTWFRETLTTIRSVHPSVPLVITEIGWATSKGTEGYQAEGIVATPNEQDQELFFRSLRDWAAEQKQPYFYFSAFDENWKGGTHPNEVEKHWGVYKADRTPKLAVTGAPPRTDIKR